MAWKILSLINGIFTEREAVASSSGASDAGKIPALDETGKLASNMMPVGMGAETQSIVCSENLTAGDFVNIYENAGVVNCRKSDATASGKEANGFVLTAGTATQEVTVYTISQTNTQLTGLTAGNTYYITTTPGTISTTPPTGTGNVVQKVGKAISTTSLLFSPSEPIVLA